MIKHECTYLCCMPQGACGRIVNTQINDHSGEVDERIILRLAHLGFLPGQPVRVTHIAPLICEPILVGVGNSQIALTRQEAALISVEVD